MPRITRDSLMTLEAYARERPQFRARVMAHKKDRTLHLGEHVTLLFEDELTIRYQVQEMLRVERIRAPEKVQHELDVYNELLPQSAELSATLMIEITEPGAIRAELDRMLGIDACVFLVLGDGANAIRVTARFDTAQLEEERISAVHYLRFPVKGKDTAETSAAVEATDSQEG